MRQRFLQNVIDIRDQLVHALCVAFLEGAVAASPELGTPLDTTRRQLFGLLAGEGFQQFYVGPFLMGVAGGLLAGLQSCHLHRGRSQLARVARNVQRALVRRQHVAVLFLAFPVAEKGLFNGPLLVYFIECLAHHLPKGGGVVPLQVGPQHLFHHLRVLHRQLAVLMPHFDYHNHHSSTKSEAAPKDGSHWQPISYAFPGLNCNRRRSLQLQQLRLTMDKQISRIYEGYDGSDQLNFNKESEHTRTCQPGRPLEQLKTHLKEMEGVAESEERQLPNSQEGGPSRIGIGEELLNGSDEQIEEEGGEQGNRVMPHSESQNLQENIIKQQQPENPGEQREDRSIRHTWGQACSGHKDERTFTMQRIFSQQDIQNRTGGEIECMPESEVSEFIPSSKGLSDVQIYQIVITKQQLEQQLIICGQSLLSLSSQHSALRQKHDELGVEAKELYIKLVQKQTQCQSLRYQLQTKHVQSEEKRLQSKSVENRKEKTIDSLQDIVKDQKRYIQQYQQKYNEISKECEGWQQAYEAIVPRFQKQHMTREQQQQLVRQERSNVQNQKYKFRILTIQTTKKEKVMNNKLDKQQQQIAQLKESLSAERSRKAELEEFISDQTKLFQQLKLRYLEQTKALVAQYQKALKEKKEEFYIQLSKQKAQFQLKEIENQSLRSEIEAQFQKDVDKSKESPTQLKHKYTSLQAQFNLLNLYKRQIETCSIGVLQDSSTLIAVLRGKCQELVQSDSIRSGQHEAEMNNNLALILSLSEALEEERRQHRSNTLTWSKQQITFELQIYWLSSVLMKYKQQQPDYQHEIVANRITEKAYETQKEADQRIHNFQQEALDRQAQTIGDFKMIYQRILKAEKTNFQTEIAHVRRKVEKLTSQLELNQIVHQQQIKELHLLLATKEKNNQLLRRENQEEKNRLQKRCKMLKESVRQAQEQLEKIDESYRLVQAKNKLYETSWQVLQNTAFQIQLKDQKDQTLAALLKVLTEEDKQNQFKTLAGTMVIPLQYEFGLQTTVEYLQAGLVEKQTKLKVMTQQMIELKGKIQVLMGEKANISNRLNCWEKSRIQEKQTTNDYTTELASKNREIQQLKCLQRQHKEMVASNSTKLEQRRQSEVNQLKQNIQVLQRASQSRDALQFQVNKLKGQNQTLNSRLISLNGQSRLHENKKDRLQKETVMEIKRQSQYHNISLANPSIQIASLKQKISIYKQQLSQLEAALRTSEAKIGSMRDEKQAQEQAVTQLKQENEIIKLQLQSMRLRLRLQKQGQKQGYKQRWKQGQKERQKEGYKQKMLQSSLKQGKAQDKVKPLVIHRFVLDSPESSVVQCSPFFIDSAILRERDKQTAFLVNSIQKYVEKTMVESTLKLRMENRITNEKKVLEYIDKETIVWLFRKGENIFGAVSFDASAKKDLSVIMFSLEKLKVVYPAESNSRWTSIKSESFYLGFGQGEARFVWKNKVFVVTEKTRARYFQADVSLSNDLLGRDRIEVDEFEVFFLKFSK